MAKNTKEYLTGMALYATGGIVASVALPFSAVTCAIGGVGFYLYRQHATISTVVDGTASGTWKMMTYFLPGSKTNLTETVSEYERITELVKDDILRLEAVSQLDKQTLDEKVKSLEKETPDADDELEKLKRKLREKEKEKDV